MMQRRLDMRPWPFVVMALIAGPIIGMTALWLYMIAPILFRPNFDLRGSLLQWEMMLVGGGAASLVVELVVVAPLLFAFRRYRWSWINTFWGGILGVLLGIAPLAPSYVAAFSGSSVSPRDWAHILTVSVMFGSVGLISAMAFRVIAVRSTETDLASSTLSA
jgi:hypothetical protein